MKKKLGMSLIALAAASAMLVACGGGDDPAPAVVGGSNVTAPVTAATAAAVTGESFNFPNGVAKFGTTSATTVALNSTSTFTISAGAQGQASGNLTFGSCIFTVTASTFPANSALGLGKTVTVHPCSITVATAGVPAAGNAVARGVSFVLEGNASQAHNLSVDISDSGVVTVDGVDVGSVTLTPVTGGS